MKSSIELSYFPASDTLDAFHRCDADYRAIIGPVGSGKTSAAAWECLYFIPRFLYHKYNIHQTRGVIVRNTYRELRDTTQKTVFQWFPYGSYQAKDDIYIIKWPEGYSVEVLFRACDREGDLKKFKSLEITWFWIDEAIEVSEEIKRMLKSRIGRFPPLCPRRYGIETSNPPDVEHPLYWQYQWDSPPPGPVPENQPLENHYGFWQKPGENAQNLRPGYYDDLRADYAHNPDWISVYIEGKPGVIMAGKAVFPNFNREIHVSKSPLIWSKGELYRGWDHTGNSPACVVLQTPTAGQVQVLKEFTADRMGIVDFARMVVWECNRLFPDATYTDYGDPAGTNRFSTREGGFTSNSQLIQEAVGISIIPSEQNWEARREAVDQLLRMRDGLLIDFRCTKLINGLMGGYHYPEIGKSGVYRNQPEKNRFSHICDALQYVAVKLAGNKTTNRIVPEEIRKYRSYYTDNYISGGVSYE